MRRPLKIVLFAATILSPIYGQNESSTVPLPPAMQSAIDRLIRDPAVGERTVVFPSRPAAVLLSQAEQCSVPLLEMRESPEQFTMRTAPPLEMDDPMPRAQVPAPPCQSAPRP
jgi:hypothetical protein